MRETRRLVGQCWHRRAGSRAALGRVGRIRLLVVGAIAAVSLAPAVPVGAAIVRQSADEVAIGVVPHLAPGTARIGTLSSGRRLEIRLALRPSHPSALARLVGEVTDPSSPQYRRYLARGAFARAFGAPPATVRALRRHLARAGLGRGRLSTNRLSLAVSGRVGAIEAALGTSLVRFRQPSGGDVYANVRPAHLPATIARSVVAVLGLDDVAPPTPTYVRLAEHAGRVRPLAVLAHSGAAAAQPACADALGAAGLSASEIADAYSMSPLYDAGDTGAGTTVAIIEFSAFRASDIATYAACYGQAPPSVTAVPVGGPPSRAGAAALETELDIEGVVGLAPDASVLVYEGAGTAPADAYATYEAAIDEDRAQVISTSWGSCEESNTSTMLAAEYDLFAQAALQGQSIVAASGDQGSEDCFDSMRGPDRDLLAVDDPASQPYVTGVGGTTLSLSPSPSESVWNGSGENAGAGGGGISSLWAMPRYQHDATTLGVLAAGGGLNPCRSKLGACREVPDVSVDAGTPYAVYCTLGTLCSDNGGWESLGGTSAGAPTWAALLALADAAPACEQNGRVGFANPALYAIASRPGLGGAFSDITSGDNDFTRTNGGRWRARPGFDLASGLGTPIAATSGGGGLVGGLCSPQIEASSHATGTLPLPAVVQIRPRTAHARGGASLTITGRNFVGVRAVDFGGIPTTSFRVASAHRLYATVPAGTGTVHILVRTRAGRSARTGSSLFRYLVPPVVGRLAPRLGASSGGTAVVIVGAHLAHTRAVRFGGRPASFRVLSDHRVLASAPPGHGVVPVSVTTSSGPSGRAHSARFTYR